MQYTFDKFELITLLREAARLGGMEVAKAAGILKDEISQREAYRIYGEARVKRWKREGLIRRIKEGENNSKALYSRCELELIETTERYLPVYNNEHQ